MKRTLILLVFILVSVVLVCIGCKKKEGEVVKPAGDTNTQAQPAEQPKQPQENEKDVEPPPPPPVGGEESAQDKPPASATTKPLTKKPRRLPAKDVKPAGAAESGAAPALTPAELSRFDTLVSADEKREFISELADARPEATPALVNKALDDKDAEVRLAAMEALVEQEASGPEALEAVRKGLGDESEEVRESAVEACGYLDEPEAGELLAEAVNDESEDVRTAAIQAADEKDATSRLNVLKAGISSRYEDVKEASVSSLIDLSTPQAVDVLLLGLKDPNPEFRETVADALDFLIDQEFKTYDEGAGWWRANRGRFDEELNEKD